MTDTNYAALVKQCQLHRGGVWMMTKEHQIWGRCQTFKDHLSGEVLYFINGKPYTEEQLTEYLRDNYRPPYVPFTPETEFSSYLADHTLQEAIDHALFFVG